MPTPYLEKLHEDHGIPMERLEEYWDKAKAIANKSGKGYGYVVGILKNMLSLSEHVSLSDSRHVPSWWKDLNTEQQTEYIREHPGSKLSPMRRNPNDLKRVNAPTYNNRKPRYHGVPLKTPAAKPTTAPTEPSNQHTVPAPAPSPSTQAPEPSGPAPSILGPKTFNLRRIMRRKYLKRRAKISHTLRHHKRGMSAIKTLIGGGNVNERDYEQAKTTAMLGLKLVAVAAIGVLAFTAIGPLMGPLAQLFLTDNTGGSFSSASGESDEDFAATLADKMYEWLEGQDQETLMARIEELKAKEKQQ